jgi:CspA family cold shock protein
MAAEDRSDGWGPLRLFRRFTKHVRPRGGRKFVKSGIVKWFNSRKGYGVIQPFDGGFNVYVDIKAVERAGLAELKEGQKVNFDIVPDNRTGKVFAENLSVLLGGQEDIIAGQAAFRRDGRGKLRMN